MSLKNIILNIALFVAAVTLQTCKPDDGPKPCESTTTYHYLTADQLSKTPYFTNPAFDTISFASNKGDTVTFALKKIDTTYYIEDTNNNPNRICNYWQYHQNILATYNTIKGNGSFEVLHPEKNKFTFSNGRPTDVYSGYVRFNFNGIKFYIRDINIGTNNGGSFVDKMTFNNREFSNCNFLFAEFSESAIGKIFINKEYGVLSFEDKINNTNWTIIEP
jgi:hypothetical protein